MMNLVYACSSEFNKKIVGKEFNPYYEQRIVPSIVVHYSAKKIIYTRQARQHGKSKWTFLKKSKLLFDSILGFNCMPDQIIILIGAY